MLPCLDSIAGLLSVAGGRYDCHIRRPCLRQLVLPAAARSSRRPCLGHGRLLVASTQRSGAARTGWCTTWGLLRRCVWSRSKTSSLDVAEHDRDCLAMALQSTWPTHQECNLDAKAARGQTPATAALFTRSRAIQVVLASDKLRFVGESNA